MRVMPEHIILWRHAQAEELFAGDDMIQIDTAQSDMQRALTEKGQRQAAAMAMWLKPQLPTATILQCSPALRAFQTAEALQEVNKSCKININQALKPGASLNTVLACIAQTNLCDSLVLVGHQPWLGQLAAHLLGFSEAEIAIKKGAIWWLRLDNNAQAQYRIHTVQTPSLL